MLLPLLPADGPRDVLYDSLAALCVVVGVLGAHRLPTAVRRGWMLVLLGLGGWLAADVVFSVEQHVVHYDGYPAPSDAVDLAAYVVIAAGLLRLVRGRQNRSDPTPLLDAAIVAVGFGIVVVTFLIAPISTDSTLSVAGRLAASGYPVADVLLIGVVVRLWSTVGARTRPFAVARRGADEMGADLIWSVIALRDPGAERRVARHAVASRLHRCRAAASTRSASQLGSTASSARPPHPRTVGCWPSGAGSSCPG